MSPVVFETKISTGNRPQVYTFDRKAVWTGVNMF
jgi:hypothetical protein